VDALTKKVTISVPDGLHEKMMEWKNSFNFSRVFQKAISDLIQKKEDFQKRLKGDDEMTEIIERLRREKAEAEEGWFEQGIEDGFDFARSASYEDLKEALSWPTIAELSMTMNVTGHDPTENEGLGDYFAGMFETYEEFDFEETVPNYYMPNSIYIKWEAGWKKAIKAFWNEIKDKI